MAEVESPATKRRKVIVAYRMITAAATIVWWNSQHIAREPRIDYSIAREVYLRRLYYGSDRVCYEQLRLNKHCFTVLCNKLREEQGLTNSMHITLEEQVAMFLHLLAYNLTNRQVGFDFIRSGETVSRYFYVVLRAILRMGKQYVVQPEVEMEGFEDEKWDWFENCLGALDGTHVEMSVPSRDQGIYRNRKGKLSTNVLAACSRDLRFTYVLPGWEGSAADSRVLRDALVRQDPLIIPKGKYFLVDAGYTNGPGLLAPYRGVRYHLNEWSARGNNPQNPKELFNLRHATARNVIERAFGVLKRKWKILRHESYFDVKTHVSIINACVILHNFIRVEAPSDPVLVEVEAELLSQPIDDDVDGNNEDEGEEFLGGEHVEETSRIKSVQTTTEWSMFRDTLAKAMFIDYQSRKKC